MSTSATQGSHNRSINAADTGVLKLVAFYILMYLNVLTRSLSLSWLIPVCLFWISPIWVPGL